MDICQKHRISAYCTRFAKALKQVFPKVGNHGGEITGLMLVGENRFPYNVSGVPWLYLLAVGVGAVYQATADSYAVTNLQIVLKQVAPDSLTGVWRYLHFVIAGSNGTVQPCTQSYNFIPSHS